MATAGMGCGSTVGGTMFEGRPRACVPAAECTYKAKRGSYAPEGTPPTLPMGEIVDLSPPVGALPEGGGYAVSMTFDPNNTAILYVGFEFKNGGSPKNGLWRSKDGGSTWKLLGTGSDPNPYDCTSSYLDLPIKVDIDPNDSNHIYVTEGVRGAGNGFWVSWDGGETWVRAYSGDLTAMSIDPCDFCHVLVGSHDGVPVGALETTDGGYSWIKHPPPANAGWGGGSYGLSFLFDPKTKQGDRNTWLVHNQAMWRTTDAGTTWNKVSDIPGIHGFTTLYYASNGTLYSGAHGQPGRSMDNGKTWSAATGLASQVYFGITGDGTNLYAQPDGYPPPSPLMTSPETDGLTWKVYGSGAPAKRGMALPHFDPNSGILYYVNNLTLNAVRVKSPSP